jgi:hypothetical protein
MGEKRGYLAGPLESFGDLEENKAAMRADADRLRDQGWIIYCPADGPATTRESHQRKNLAQLVKPCGLPGMGLELDALLVRPGWEQSDGAKLEVAIAYEIGLPVLNAVTLLPVLPIAVVSGPSHTSPVSHSSHALSQDQQAIAAVFDEAKTLALQKNHDYGSSVFERPVLAPCMNAGAAILVRMSDKINRLQTLLAGEKAQVADEAATDTMRDLATYAFIWLIQQRRNAAPVLKGEPCNQS